ncbi:MAG TPA: anthranilate synthase, partial [Azospirillaceae bacterium]|nr:anthranilate synthase [Azospirillaceae bacterium]
MTPHAYRTQGGLDIRRTVEALPYPDATAPLIAALDSRRGVLLSSGYEVPGRYTRWDLGFIDPPLGLTARGRTLRIEALNERGLVLLPPIADALGLPPTASGVLDVRVPEATERVPEELRSRQPSVFSAIRRLVELFASPEDRHLGLYGAFGYDLAFQFEPIRLRLDRPDDQRDLVLYLPDELVVVDHAARTAARHRYDFFIPTTSTEHRPRGGAEHRYRPSTNAFAACDHAPGEYVQVVETARAAFHRGDLFEAVPGQTFAEPCAAPPSDIFRRLKTANPAPYGALINLGDGEFLVAASPEMFVRVEGRRVETCPISGTIARGRDAIGDAEQILRLLNSEKDAAELTMCTDVDRNDKSRICEPGSVRVIGRRQIELYSRLIHTVDHVEGTLRDGFDALDAFLTHTWAVTVTGAPKRWAMQFLEDHEKSSRRWYGGALGAVTFDGGLNTGLTLRTIRMKDGVAEIRAGATLLYDSDAAAEDAECRLKASALFAAIHQPAATAEAAAKARPGEGKRILFVDHEDSFVHTLANYFRQTGAEVETLRADLARAALAETRPDLVVLSP